MTTTDAAANHSWTTNSSLLSAKEALVRAITALATDGNYDGIKGVTEALRLVDGLLQKTDLVDGLDFETRQMSLGGNKLSAIQAARARSGQFRRPDGTVGFNMSLKEAKELGRSLYD